jgi:hypothetical protein
MSWIGLDDGILEHPKFIRAVNMAGSEAVHLWLGLRAYCARHLTDGHVPADMVDEVRGPRGRKRQEALAALVHVGLLEQRDGAIIMHDYLDWSESRDSVLRKRAAARERQAKSRGMSQRDSERSNEEVQRESQPPLLSSPILIQPPVSPPPGLPPARPKRRQAADVPDLLAPDWAPPPETVAAQVARWNATEAQIRRTIPEFRDFWIREGKRKNLAGWLRAWTNRVAQLAKQGVLWVDDLRQVQPRQGFQRPPGLVIHEQFSVPIGEGKAQALLAAARREQKS